MPASFGVNCVGHQGKSSHTEYVFRVRHSSGCEWTVSRRYQDLLDLHERLCAVFGEKDLPPFPPRSMGGMVATLLGQRPGCQPEVVAERERLFQRYFDRLCDRSDVVSTACFQQALAVQPPEPVSHLRVQGWLPPPDSGQGATALVEVRPEAASGESSAVPEVYHVRGLRVFGPEDNIDGEELCLVSDVRQLTVGKSTLARVEGLKPGAQVELEVSAANAVGRSAPVSIRVMVPEAAGAAASSPSSPPSPTALAGSSPAEALAAEELRIQKEREELERWWGDRQREAEKADAVREELMNAFRAQREAFAREVSESSRCRSPSATASPEPSPLVSPRNSNGTSTAATSSGGQAAAAAAPCAAEVGDVGSRHEEELLRFEELEASRARHEEERARQEEVLASRAEDLLRQEEESQASRARQEEERARQEESLASRAEDLRRREERLASQAEHLAETENALRQERQELTAARGNLAVVQAHIVSMLASNQDGDEAKEVCIDDGSTPHHSFNPDGGDSGLHRDASADGEVWNMDWVNPFKDQIRRDSREHLAEEEDEEREAVCQAAGSSPAVAATQA